MYQWRTPKDPAPALRLAQAAIDGRLHAVTFTAAPAVANLFALAAGAGIAGALRDAFNRDAVVAACVGPVCARGASDAGILAPLVPPVGRLGLMVRALVEHLAGERRTVAMAGVDVVLQGLVAMVGECPGAAQLPGARPARRPGRAGPGPWSPGRRWCGRCGRRTAPIPTPSRSPSPGCGPAWARPAPPWWPCPAGATGSTRRTEVWC